MIAVLVHSIAVAWDPRLGFGVAIFSDDYQGGVIRSCDQRMPRLVASPARPRPIGVVPPVEVIVRERVRRAARVPSAGEALTERERSVLSSIVLGQTNSEIAVALGVSAHTAKFHVDRIVRKLGTKNRTEAAAVAVRTGLVS